MWRGTLEIKTVARLHAVMLICVQPDFEFATQDVQEFFAFVSVRFAAAAAGLDTKKMRLHGSVAPGEQLHADALGGFKNFALGWAHQFGIVLGRLEERKNIGAIVARDAPQGANGSAHLATFESAQKTDGNFRGAGNLREGKIAALAEAAKTQSGGSGIFRGRNNSLTLENVDDGGGIESASATKKKSALQEAHVRFTVEAIAAARALRRDEAESFPGAQSGGRDSDATGDFANAQ